MTLHDWVDNGWLAAHRTSASEVRDLLGVFAREERLCALPGIDDDSRLLAAYNAALQIAIAALAVTGFRVRSEAHHFRAIESLRFTLGTDDATVRRLEFFRKRRNVTTYKRANTVTRAEADEIQALATELRTHLIASLRRDHPGLLPAGDR